MGTEVVGLLAGDNLEDQASLILSMVVLSLAVLFPAELYECTTPCLARFRE